MASTAAKQINNSHQVKAIMAKQANSIGSGSLAFSSLPQLNVPGTSIKQISDSVAVPNIENPSYYIFNYVGGGFVILASDKRAAPVLAFSNTGYFKYPAESHTGLDDWLTFNLKNMQVLRQDTSVKAPASVSTLWAQITQPATTQTTAAHGLSTFKVDPPPPPCVDGDSVTIFGPLLHTTWTQSYPFNLLCPADANSSAGDNFDPAGCVATAIGQVMYYWQYPAQYGSHVYDWGGMPINNSPNSGTSSGIQSVQQLMVDIGFAVGMNYGTYGSGASASAIAPGFNFFGYSSAIYVGYGFYTSYSTLQNDINSGRPVVLGGSDSNYGGHAWVCDAYQIDSYIDCEDDTATNYLLLGMNWGLTDQQVSNGWYSFANWTIYEQGSPVYINNSLSMVYYIHP